MRQARSPAGISAKRASAGHADSVYPCFPHRAFRPDLDTFSHPARLAYWRAYWNHASTPIHYPGVARLAWLGADGAVQRMGHEEKAVLFRSVARGMPQRQFLKRQLRQHVIFAVAPDRPARPVERHQAREANEIDKACLVH